MSTVASVQRSVALVQHCGIRATAALDRCFSATVVSIQQSSSTLRSGGLFVVFLQHPMSYSQSKS